MPIVDSPTKRDIKSKTVVGETTFTKAVSTPDNSVIATEIDLTKDLIQRPDKINCQVFSSSKVETSRRNNEKALDSKNQDTAKFK